MVRKPPTIKKVDSNIQEAIKKLAKEQDRPLNDLLEEAAKDLLKKYRNISLDEVAKRR